MRSNKEIKSTARRLLQGNFNAFVILFLTGYIIQSLIVSLPSVLLTVPEHLPLFLSQILLTILLEALGAMVMLGISRAALHLERGEAFGPADLVFAFKNEPDHFLALELILTAVNTITSVPVYILSWISSSSNMSFLTYTLLSALFTGLSIVLTFLFTMGISMSEFLMLDFPDMDAWEALKSSMEIIKGHIGQYFRFMTGFLGYILLGLASAMIGFIWIIPYMVVSQAVFYENLWDLAVEAADAADRQLHKNNSTRTDDPLL